MLAFGRYHSKKGPLGGSMRLALQATMHSKYLNKYLKWFQMEYGLENSPIINKAREFLDTFPRLDWGNNKGINFSDG